MDLFEVKEINVDRWTRFNKILSFYCRQPEFTKLLLNTKLIYNTFYPNPAPIEDIESLLQKELKLHFWFFDSEPKAFKSQFNKLPFITKVILLRYCEEKKICELKFTPKDKEKCLLKIKETKKNLGHKIFDYCARGYKQTNIPLKTFITLIQYNCFDIKNNVDSMVVEFFTKYLNHPEISESLKESNFYNFACDLFFSSKTYKDFHEMYNSGDYVKKIDLKTLDFLKQQEQGFANDTQEAEPDNSTADSEDAETANELEEKPGLLAG